MSLLRHLPCLWNMLAIAAVAILLPSRNFCQKTNADSLQPITFKTDSLRDKLEVPKPYLISISVNGRKLMQGVSLGSSVPLQLGHGQNTLAFEFSSIAFGGPQTVRYRYRLQGFDKDWRETSQPSIRYTHLPPNRYSFQLLALDGDGHHVEQPLEWHFHILSPWWGTWWAYLAYLLFAAAATYAFYLHKKKERQMRQQMAMVRMEAERLQESDALKTKLYANITHELRTPLTVILGMVKQIQENPKDWYSEGLQMIERNGNNLLRLVKQLLDLSRLEAGAMPVRLVQGEVVAFLKYLLKSFRSMAAEKDIALKFHADREEWTMDYDPEKLQEILSNLVTNALKFTPTGGEVELKLEIGQSVVLISISDTGIGIPPDKLPFIFERFYQVGDEAARCAVGTGIGLTLTKELVKLLGGDIAVKSQLGKGTQFEVRLPFANSESSPDFQIRKKEDRETGELDHLEKRLHSPSFKDGAENPPCLLIVEDNPDVVRYLQSFLSENYRIETAPDGRQGIEKAIEIVPDIIISDVMMPETDGFELCEMLKKHERTSHIPIILLTAKTDLASRLKGLEKGADAYLNQPFYKEELVMRLRKMLSLRHALRARFAKENELFLKGDRHSIADEEFMKKVLGIMEERYMDEGFDISELCQALCLSRAQCYRKVTALTGEPVAHLLRKFRLQKAKDLLSTTSLSISQIALEVGFKDLTHFSHCFHQHFGINASEIRKRDAAAKI